MIATIHEMNATEQAEYSIIDTLRSLSTAQQDADKLTPAQAFAVGCALIGAREALNRALAIVAQTQAQPHMYRRAA